MAVHPKIINKAVLHYLFPEVLFLHKIKIVNILLWKISLTKIDTAILSRILFSAIVNKLVSPFLVLPHQASLYIVVTSYHMEYVIGIGINIFKSHSVFRYCICIVSPFLALVHTKFLC